MNPSCARGSGPLPRYVEWIDRHPADAMIRLAGEGVPPGLRIVCATEDELRESCRRLAEQRYLFSIGARAGCGPGEIMSEWQAGGLPPLSFLQVSWTGPGEWQVHEIVPGVQQWDIRPLRDILKDEPLR